MAMYYIENENGTFLSEDGKRRFIRLCGREAYDYLRSAEGKKKRFMKTSTREDGGEEEYVEVPLAYMRKHRKDERHRQYVSDTRNESGITVISVNDLISSDGEVTGIDVIQDDSVDIEETVIHAGEIETLHKALETLTEEELWLVTKLYLSDEPTKELQLSRETGIPQKTLNDRKMRVLAKLKNFF